MISLSRVGARLRRRTHRPQVIRAVIYLRYCAWRNIMIDGDIENLEDMQAWHEQRPKTAHLTKVLPLGGTTQRIAIPDQVTGRMEPQR